MDELNVLYACDNNYAPYCGVSMFSLFSNNQDLAEIKVYLVADNITEDNCEKLKSTAEHFERKLQIIDAAQVKQLMERLGVPMYRGSYATHYRKFFQMIIPETVQFLLYLDADTVVPGSLIGLLNLDMQGKCLGVVLDALGGRYKKLLGFQTDELYFNAGVTWIDVKAWKERDYSNKLMDHIQNVRAKYFNPDQDLFNMVLKNDTVALPPEYNFMPAHRAYSDKAFFRCYPREGYYSQQELEFARCNPKIIHAYRFLGEFPWHKGNCHPDNDLFDSYLSRSEWSGYVKKPANIAPMFKLEKLMYRTMPRGLFLQLFSKVLYHTMKKRNDELIRESEIMKNEQLRKKS